MKACGLVILSAILILAAGCSTPAKKYSVDVRKVKDTAEAASQGGEAETKPVVRSAAEYEQAGDRYLSQGNGAAAFIQYGSALATEPGLHSARKKRAGILHKRKMYEEAEKDYAILVKASPEDPSLHEEMGTMYFSSGDLGKAAEHLERAVSLNGSLWKSHNMLGVVYDRQGRHDAAEPHFRRALELMPKSGVLYNNLAMSYYLKGDYENAARVFVQALKLEHDRQTTKRLYNNLALVLSRAGRYAEALELFKKAGSEASAQNNIGYMYLRDGRYKEAIRSFEQALEISPRFYIRAYENLLKAKAENGS